MEDEYGVDTGSSLGVQRSNCLLHEVRASRVEAFNRDGTVERGYPRLARGSYGADVWGLCGFGGVHGPGLCNLQGYLSDPQVRWWRGVSRVPPGGLARCLTGGNLTPE
ncbi:hypothetical protein GCM10010350_55000 [Streptomyces galilaeus]|nr:hypothetical protein GCM10010350_55000 [Streptomyces galilaeus]